MARVLPPFISKLYSLVSDETNHEYVNWCEDGKTFKVEDPNPFSEKVLPKYFKHSNFCSFVRQLNTYGFHKNGQEWLFEHEKEYFVKDKKELLSNITRRKQVKRNRPHETSVKIEPGQWMIIQAQLETLQARSESQQLEMHRLLQQSAKDQQALNSMRQTLQMVINFLLTQPNLQVSDLLDKLSTQPNIQLTSELKPVNGFYNNGTNANHNQNEQSLYIPKQPAHSSMWPPIQGAEDSSLSIGDIYSHDLNSTLQDLMLDDFTPNGGET